MSDQPRPEGALDVRRWLGRCMPRSRQRADIRFGLARRVALAGLLVQLVAALQDLHVLPTMALSRRHVQGQRVYSIPMALNKPVQRSRVASRGGNSVTTCKCSFCSDTPESSCGACDEPDFGFHVKNLYVGK